MRSTCEPYSSARQKNTQRARSTLDQIASIHDSTPPAIHTEESVKQAFYFFSTGFASFAGSTAFFSLDLA
jgi:hypothetical protein